MRRLYDRLARAAGNRCGYCHAPQELVPVRFEAEHLHPKARGGIDDERNRYLACPACNRFKGSRVSAPDPLSGHRVRLFNPRSQSWRRHFRWTSGGSLIEGLTATGRATVSALQLNAEIRMPARLYWVQTGDHPPPMDL